MFSRKMNLNASLLLASRMAFPRRGGFASGGRASLFGAALCIALSLVPLVAALAVSGGMIESITLRTATLSSHHARIITDRPVGSAELAALADALKTVGGVTGAYPEKQGIALASAAAGRVGAAVRAVAPELFAEGGAFARLFSVRDGSMALPLERSALVGSKIASALGIRAGDTLRLTALRQGATGAPTPRTGTFTVAGIISCGYQELDALWVFIPLATGFSLLPEQASSAFVGVETGDPFSGGFQAVLGNLRSVAPSGYSVVPWQQMNAAQYESFASTRTMLLLVTALIVLSAAANVSSALTILAAERRQEIAVLKSLGGNEGGIALSFLLAGLSAGAAGTALGIPLGLACAAGANGITAFADRLVNAAAKLVYSASVLAGGRDFSPVRLLDPALYPERIPADAPLASLLVIAAGTLALSALAAVAPGIRAGKERPIRALRKR
jgi:lipoprotein-releasing system permease protein